MSWNCVRVKSLRFVTHEPPVDGIVREMMYTLPDGREVDFNSLPVGACWHSSEAPAGSYCNENEPTWCVVLPGKMIWRMNHPGTNGFMWTVQGEAPNLTASPSINFHGTYHGWVQGGVVTDDCEGRKFKPDGTPA